MEINELRRDVAAVLTRAADTQEHGDLWAIDAEFEDLESRIGSLSDSIPGDLDIVQQFIDGWADARNHDWRYYEPLQAQDWPRLAREIGGHVVSETPITSPEILNQFGPASSARTGCLGSLLGRFGG